MNALPTLDVLAGMRFPDVAWDYAARPVVIADGKVLQVRKLDAPLRADAAYVVGVNQQDFDHLCRHLRATAVHFYEMRVEDLSALPRIGALTALRICWNTKIVSLEPLKSLGGLEALSISDTPKIRDLTPIGGLVRLRALEFAGGVWNKNVANSLEPIGRLVDLGELRLLNLRVLDGGLLPLARCAKLRRFDVSNQFATADYAYLSVGLPETSCDYFAAYLPLGQEIDGKDVMVVGSGKPLLHSVRDAARLSGYVEGFRQLQERFAAER